jgi:hypothetical protein
MFYEEKLIDGRLYCRGTPDGEWRLVTIDALTRRVLAAEADLERAMENHAADLSAAPEATPPVKMNPAIWDGTIRIDSDCIINGVEVKAGTILRPGMPIPSPSMNIGGDSSGK